MKLSTQILLAFSIILILSILDSGSNYMLSLKVQKNSRFLNKSQEIIRHSGRIHKSIIEMQSSFRGFLLTEDSNFLRNYTFGLNTISPNIMAQKKLVKGNADQEAILDSITLLHKQWIEYAGALIAAKKAARISKDSIGLYNELFESRFKKQVGRRLNDAIAVKFGEFNKKEYEIRNVYDKILAASIRRTHTFSLIFLSLTVIVGIASIVYIIRLISKRIKSMVNLAESISKGEFTTVNDDRKDELTSLSTSLNIMSERLSKNIRELEIRNTELDKFAYVVSHDLKAPLRGIHHAVNWIEEDMGKELSPEMQKYLSIIPQRLKRMEDLINGLLAYARTREKTKPEEVDVMQLVEEIVETIVPGEFKVEIKKLPVIVTERLKLEQVFTNLISNAVKYTPQENGQISIEYREMPAHHEFSVKDNGIGIETEYHEKIFEIFQTLREKDEKESTGIGLAIIKKILDDQHSTIRVNSVFGNGTEFIFTWPKSNRSI